MTLIPIISYFKTYLHFSTPINLISRLNTVIAKTVSKRLRRRLFNYFLRLCKKKKKFL
jgi:hypothetical protein